VPTESLPKLERPEFAPLRARLVRVYLDHKAALSVPQASDEEIADHVDEITGELFGMMARVINLRRLDVSIAPTNADDPARRRPRSGPHRPEHSRLR